MAFSVNHPILYAFTIAGILMVSAQSVIFLVKALKRTKELNIDQAKIKKIIKSTIIFSIAPAVAVGIGLFTLVPLLGIPLPWLRLSVVGALTYELPAAQAAADAMNIQVTSGLTAQQFVTIAWTMTIGIITGLVLIPVFCKKEVTGLSSSNMKDKKWADHFSNALFFGLIATFVGGGLADVTVNNAGKVKGLVLLISALIMAVCGLLRNKFKWQWINDYAIPISMILSMAAAIPLTILLG